jgi:hypothetical protein
MKQFITPIFLLAFIFSAAASAASQALSEKQVFAFKYKLKGESFEYTQASTSYETAFEAAAKACYQHFKGGHHISEDQGLDIIDVCANPRS